MTAREGLFANGRALVLQANALSLPLSDASVDLIVTSPPYFALRSYQDAGTHYEGQIGSEDTPVAFLEALWAVMDECWRVLKPTGSAWINLGDKYAGSGGHNNSGISDKSTLRGNGHVGGVGKAGPQKIKATRRSAPDRYNQNADSRAKSVMGLPWRFALGCSVPDPYRTCYDPGEHPQWILRRPHIWAKPNGLPESVTDRCRANYEDVFMFTKQGQYFAAVDEIREPIVYPDDVGPSRLGDKYSTGGGEDNAVRRFADRSYNPLGRLPGSVWSVPSESLIIPEWAREKYDLPDHFAAFPTELPRRIILGFCPDGGTVLDPMGGTGTTAMVARALGRTGMSVDLSHDYSRLAEWRIFHSGHGTKAVSLAARERQESLEIA